MSTKLVFYSSNTSRDLRSFKLVIFFEQREENILKRNVEITLRTRKEKNKKKETRMRRRNVRS